MGLVEGARGWRRELRPTRVDVAGHFCADDDGTLVSSRAQVVVHSEEAVVQELLVELTEEGYGHAHPLCENLFGVSG